MSGKPKPRVRREYSINDLVELQRQSLEATQNLTQAIKELTQRLGEVE